MEKIPLTVLIFRSIHFKIFTASIGYRGRTQPRKVRYSIPGSSPERVVYSSLPSSINPYIKSA